MGLIIVYFVGADREDRVVIHHRDNLDGFVMRGGTQDLSAGARVLHERAGRSPGMGRIPMPGFCQFLNPSRLAETHVASVKRLSLPVFLARSTFSSAA